MPIFEQAARQKLRFHYKGQLSIEDLWDLRVEDLDNIYRELNAQLKAANEDSLLNKPTVASATLALKVGVVKRIVEVKLAEAEERKTAAERLQKKRRIQEILAEKRDASLASKSEEELAKMLEEL